LAPDSFTTFAERASWASGWPSVHSRLADIFEEPERQRGFAGIQTISPAT
jgi:hypothetical protein